LADWIQDLPLAGLIAIVFSATFLVTLGIYVVVTALAVGDRARAFKAFSPGMLPPMGLLFALLVGFMAAQIWSEAGRAQDAVDREASALRSVVLLAEGFPDATERFDALVERHIRTAVDEEWPAMAQQRATLTVVPAPLAEALQLAIGLSPGTDGERTAQRELVDAVQDALDARRQRIIVSETTLNWVKWTGVILVALLTLIAIAFVHSDNRLTAKLALGVFAVAVATSLTLLAAQERPFSGQFAVEPDVLLQVQPEP
jgi:energy-coupling factor transporter transmembrane protein EcfT